MMLLGLAVLGTASALALGALSALVVFGVEAVAVQLERRRR